MGAPNSKLFMLDPEAPLGFDVLDGKVIDVEYVKSAEEGRTQAWHLGIKKGWKVLSVNNQRYSELLQKTTAPPGSLNVETDVRGRITKAFPGNGMKMGLLKGYKIVGVAGKPFTKARFTRQQQGRVGYQSQWKRPFSEDVKEATGDKCPVLLRVTWSEVLAEFENPSIERAAS